MERKIEYSLLNEAIRKIDLLSASQLKKTNEITNPQLLTNKDLAPMFLFSNLYFMHHDFNAVAFNQYPDELFEKISIKKDLRNIIYFGQKKENQILKNQIIINPQIKIIEDNQSYVSIEGCGSIGMGKIQMAVMRPRNIELSGFFWNLNLEKQEEKTLQLSDWPSAMAQHEVDHLNGFSALSFPEKIVDVINLDESVLKRFGINKESWANLLKIFEKEKKIKFLVNKNGKLVLVDYSGHELK